MAASFWICSDCSFENTVMVRKCMICETFRDSAFVSTWSCSYCSFENSAVFSRCDCCGKAVQKHEAPINTEKTSKSNTTAEYNESFTKKHHATRDRDLMTGYIRETDVDYIVGEDVVNLLLLFCLIHDNFDLDVLDSKLQWERNASHENEYHSQYEKVSAAVKNSEESHNNGSQHAFAVKHISRGVKYTWNVCCSQKHEDSSVYIGVVDNAFVADLHERTSTISEYANGSHFFFSDVYRGYALCLQTGDVFHNHAKYGKPYILSPLHCKGKQIITIELDLTGRFYGTLRFAVKRVGSKHDKTEYWQDAPIAYDDILVNKQYRLVIAVDDSEMDEGLNSGSTVLLFDDYHVTD